MALWGISTTGETSDNNYAIPKYTSGSTQFDGVDINNSPHNFFADNRGWVYRHYQDGKYSGLSTSYYDELHVPVSGLNTAGAGANSTGLGLATPVAVFFADPGSGNPISVSAGSTNFISTATSAEVHLCFNETVYCGAGATIHIQTFDGNNANAGDEIVATASSMTRSIDHPIYTNDGLVLEQNFNGQVSNRIAFTFTSPSTLQTANIDFLTAAVSTGHTVSAASTVISVTNLTQTTADLPGIDLRTVAVGDSVTAGALTNGVIVSVGTTQIQISTASTIATAIAAGTAVTFSTRTNRTNLAIDMGRGFIGVITDLATAAGVTSSFSSDIIRQIGGAGSVDNTTSDTFPLGVGTTILSVRA